MIIVYVGEIILALYENVGGWMSESMKLCEGECMGGCIWREKVRAYRWSECM